MKIIGSYPLNFAPGDGAPTAGSYGAQGKAATTHMLSAFMKHSRLIFKPPEQQPNERKKRMTTKWKAKPKQQKPLRNRVEAKFVRFMESFPVTEFREVRQILRELLAKADS